MVRRNHLSLPSLRHPVVVIIITLCICVCGLSSPAQTAGEAQKEPSVLLVKVDSFHLEEADIEEGLRLLRRIDYSKILIGFEKAPHWWEGAEPTPISLELNDTTVEVVLRKLCEADPRYTYEVINGRMINVYWKGAKETPSNLMNMKIRHFSVHGNYAPEGVIVGIGELAPELRDYLREKKNQYHAQRDRFPASPGAIMTGNMTGEFDLELEDMTIREILNTIVLHSLKLHLERPPHSTGWRQPPTSWKYEFVIKPDAPTGLGGIPRWDTLN